MADQPGPGDGFRKLEEIMRPDPRRASFVVFTDEVLGKWRPYRLEDLYAGVEGLALDDTVPLDLRVQFDNARNLVIYSWFAYRFVQPAELQALRTLEFALREAFGLRRGGNRDGLARLLTRAIAEGRINGQELATAGTSGRLRGETCRGGISDVARRVSPDSFEREYLEELAEGLGQYRNVLAHGGTTLQPGGLHVLVICRNLINQLFRPRPKERESGEFSG